MSSPPPQLSFPGFGITSSPMKGFGYYFAQNNGQDDFSFQDENAAPMNMDMSLPQFGSGLEEVVPVSQNNHTHATPLTPMDPNNYQNHPQQTLQMAPKFELTPVQQSFLQQYQQSQMPPPQQQHLAPGSHQSQQEQKNLYPAMHIFQHQGSQGLIPKSSSTNTLASFESAPGLTVSHSASDNSLAMSPMSFQNANQTPRRVGPRRPSNAITPLPQVFESPNNQTSNQSPVAVRSQSHSSIMVSTTTPTAKLMRHRRTRSRLSLDIGGNRSPSGTNPFYSAFMSPHQQQSPAGTPMQTPHRHAISPNVLMSNASMTPFKTDPDQKAMFSAAADFTMKMASDYNDDAPRLLYQNNSPDKQTYLTTPTTKPLARSQSSIDLASIASMRGIKSPPREVTRYDILEPRRKKATKIMLGDAGDEKKNAHYCPLCGSMFQRPEHVKRHMRAHSSEKPFQCDEEGCGKRFNRADNMKAHLRKIHGKQI